MLLTLTKAMAPFTPFFAETMFQAKTLNPVPLHAAAAAAGAAACCPSLPRLSSPSPSVPPPPPQNLRQAQPGLPASVHFCDFPVADPKAFDARIERSVGRMNTVIELARSIRERCNRPTKTPLRRLTVVSADADFLADISGELAGYVTEEVRGHRSPA